jgi:hypothetical protein
MVGICFCAKIETTTPPGWQYRDYYYSLDLLYLQIQALLRSSGNARIVLYRCNTCSLTLREEHILKVFENRVLSRIFAAKRDEMIGRGGKPHNQCLSSNTE